MDLFCATRTLKNAKFLQSREVAFFSESEPIDGFVSLISIEALSRLERTDPREVRNQHLADAIARRRPPRPGSKINQPLFSGTLRFVQTTFSSGGNNFAVPDPDLRVVVQYSGLCAVPLSEYASQYGPNSLAVDSTPVPFDAPAAGGKYNDSILSGWVEKLAKANNYGPDTCLVFLNPQGVVNTDANATQGVLGYHNMSSSGAPYAFVNVMGTGLTLEDRSDHYALALSHEIVEMTCDPQANGSNPETSDNCSGNCGVNLRNYFDAAGNWLGSSPKPGYAFFTAGVVKPASVSMCPAPPSSCSYPPPKPGQIS